jgi:hypothetical protein
MRRGSERIDRGVGSRLDITDEAGGARPLPRNRRRRSSGLAAGACVSSWVRMEALHLAQDQDPTRVANKQTPDSYCHAIQGAPWCSEVPSVMVVPVEYQDGHDSRHEYLVRD